MLTADMDEKFKQEIAQNLKNLAFLNTLGAQSYLNSKLNKTKNELRAATSSLLNNTHITKEAADYVTQLIHRILWLQFCIDSL